LNIALDARRNRLADAPGWAAAGAGLIAVLVSFSLVVLLGLSYPYSGGLDSPRR
jgi:hypothetical protein